MTQNAVPYAMTRTLQLSYDDADQAIRGALQQEGFGILTEADVAGTFKKKLDVDIGKYEILGACAPPLAYQALQHEPDAGLLLPCNVVVRSGAHADETIVEALDPVVQLGVSRNPALLPMAEQVRARLERALDSVAQAASARS
jgi:uncharacterized protein (DUF302 family)